MNADQSRLCPRNSGTEFMVLAKAAVTNMVMTMTVMIITVYHHHHQQSLRVAIPLCAYDKYFNFSTVRHISCIFYYYYYYYYLTAVVLTPGGSSTIHIYTQTVHKIQRTEHTFQL
jgi:hypothetical protein